MNHSISQDLPSSNQIRFFGWQVCWRYAEWTQILPLLSGPVSMPSFDAKSLMWKGLRHFQPGFLSEAKRNPVLYTPRNNNEAEKWSLGPQFSSTNRWLSTYYEFQECVLVFWCLLSPKPACFAALLAIHLGVYDSKLESKKKSLQFALCQSIH